jgi:hypothetical protein
LIFPVEVELLRIGLVACVLGGGAFEDAGRNAGVSIAVAAAVVAVKVVEKFWLVGGVRTRAMEVLEFAAKVGEELIARGRSKGLGVFGTQDFLGGEGLGPGRAMANVMRREWKAKRSLVY